MSGTDRAATAIAAKLREITDGGMVPFYCIIPVSPEVLRSSPEAIGEQVGSMADRAMVKQVRRWHEQDAL